MGVLGTGVAADPEKPAEPPRVTEGMAIGPADQPRRSPMRTRTKVLLAIGAVILGATGGLVAANLHSSRAPAGAALILKPLDYFGAITNVVPGWSVQKSAAASTLPRSFCGQAAPAGPCGGPLRHTDNPTGGNGGPYIFQIESGKGSLPLGLSLQPNGEVTGTLRSSVSPGFYDFTVCMSDPTYAAGSVCRPAQIQVTSF
jgi:hypothetical protein